MVLLLAPVQPIFTAQADNFEASTGGLTGDEGQVSLLLVLILLVFQLAFLTQTEKYEVPTGEPVVEDGQVLLLV